MSNISDPMKPTTQTVPFWVMVVSLLALLIAPFYWHLLKNFLTPDELTKYAALCTAFFGALGGFGGISTIINSNKKTDAKIYVQTQQMAPSAPAVQDVNVVNTPDAPVPVDANSNTA